MPARSWFVPLIFKIAQLRERIQRLDTGVALSVDDPGRITADVLFFADRRRWRVWTAWATLYIRHALDRTAKQLFLLGTVGAPRSAVKFGVALREMLGESADPRIFRSLSVAPVAGIMKMKREDGNDGDTDGFRQPRTPRKFRQALRPLKCRNDENGRHQGERCQAIRAGGSQFKQRHRRQVKAIEQTKQRNYPSPTPLVDGIFVPSDGGQERIGEKPPKRSRHAEERRPAAVEHDIAAGALGAKRDSLILPRRNGKIAGQGHAEQRQ